MDADVERVILENCLPLLDLVDKKRLACSSKYHRDYICKQSWSDLSSWLLQDVVAQRRPDCEPCNDQPVSTRISVDELKRYEGLLWLLYQFSARHGIVSLAPGLQGALASALGDRILSLLLIASGTPINYEFIKRIAPHQQGPVTWMKSVDALDMVTDVPELVKNLCLGKAISVQQLRHASADDLFTMLSIVFTSLSTSPEPAALLASPSAQQLTALQVQQLLESALSYDGHRAPANSTSLGLSRHVLRLAQLPQAGKISDAGKLIVLLACARFNYRGFAALSDQLMQRPSLPPISVDVKGKALLLTAALMSSHADSFDQVVAKLDGGLCKSRLDGVAVSKLLVTALQKSNTKAARRLLWELVSYSSTPTPLTPPPPHWTLFSLFEGTTHISAASRLSTAAIHAILLTVVSRYEQRAAVLVVDMVNLPGAQGLSYAEVKQLLTCAVEQNSWTPVMYLSKLPAAQYVLPDYIGDLLQFALTAGNVEAFDSLKSQAPAAGIPPAVVGGLLRVAVQRGDVNALWWLVGLQGAAGLASGDIQELAGMTIYSTGSCSSSQLLEVLLLLPAPADKAYAILHALVAAGSSRRLQAIQHLAQLPAFRCIAAESLKDLLALAISSSLPMPSASGASGRCTAAAGTATAWVAAGGAWTSLVQLPSAASLDIHHVLDLLSVSLEAKQVEPVKWLVEHPAMRQASRPQKLQLLQTAASCGNSLQFLLEGLELGDSLTFEEAELVLSAAVSGSSPPEYAVLVLKALEGGVMQLPPGHVQQLLQLALQAGSSSAMVWLLQHPAVADAKAWELGDAVLVAASAGACSCLDLLLGNAKYLAITTLLLLAADKANSTVMTTLLERLAVEASSAPYPPALLQKSVQQLLEQEVYVEAASKLSPAALSSLLMLVTPAAAPSWSLLPPLSTPALERLLHLAVKKGCCLFVAQVASLPSAQKVLKLQLPQLIWDAMKARSDAVPADGSSTSQGSCMVELLVRLIAMQHVSKDAIVELLEESAAEQSDEVVQCLAHLLANSYVPSKSMVRILGAAARRQTLHSLEVLVKLHGAEGLPADAVALLLKQFLEAIAAGASFQPPSLQPPPVLPQAPATRTRAEAALPVAAAVAESSCPPPAAAGTATAVMLAGGLWTSLVQLPAAAFLTTDHVVDLLDLALKGEQVQAVKWLLEHAAVARASRSQKLQLIQTAASSANRLHLLLKGLKLGGSLSFEEAQLVLSAAVSESSPPEDAILVMEAIKGGLLQLPPCHVHQLLEVAVQAGSSSAMVWLLQHPAVADAKAWELGDAVLAATSVGACSCFDFLFGIAKYRAINALLIVAADKGNITVMSLLLERLTQEASFTPQPPALLQQSVQQLLEQEVFVQAASHLSPAVLSSVLMLVTPSASLSGSTPHLLSVPAVERLLHLAVKKGCCVFLAQLANLPSAQKVLEQQLPQLIRAAMIARSDAVPADGSSSSSPANCMVELLVRLIAMQHVCKEAVVELLEEAAVEQSDEVVQWLAHLLADSYVPTEAMVRILGAAARRQALHSLDVLVKLHGAEGLPADALGLLLKQSLAAAAALQPPPAAAARTGAEEKKQAPKGSEAEAAEASSSSNAWARFVQLSAAQSLSAQVLVELMGLALRAGDKGAVQWLLKQQGMGQASLTARLQLLQTAAACGCSLVLLLEELMGGCLTVGEAWPIFRAAVKSSRAGLHAVAILEAVEDFRSLPASDLQELLLVASTVKSNTAVGCWLLQQSALVSGPDVATGSDRGLGLKVGAEDGPNRDKGTASTVEVDVVAPNRDRGAAVRALAGAEPERERGEAVLVAGGAELERKRDAALLVTAGVEPENGSGLALLSGGSLFHVNQQDVMVIAGVRQMVSDENKVGRSKEGHGSALNLETMLCNFVSGLALLLLFLGGMFAWSTFG